MGRLAGVEDKLSDGETFFLQPVFFNLARIPVGLDRMFMNKRGNDLPSQRAGGTGTLFQGLSSGWSSD
jgi:hypothetical protein